MKDTIFLFIKVVIETTHASIHEAMQELETKSQYTIGSTPNVRVIETEIVRLQSGNVSNNSNQSSTHSLIQIQK